MKRVLLVTYYFPPSGGPGVQRALKFTRYLPSYGWMPTVLTVRPEDASFPSLDPTLAKEVPDEVPVVRTPAWDPYAAYARLQGKEKAETIGVGFVGESEANWKQRLGRWLRANVFLPDARVGWVPFAVRAGSDLAKKEPFDALLTTGPPHSVHLAGAFLARRFGLPWVADFRDPWTGIDYYAMLPMSALARELDRRLERMVLSRASAVTVVSPSMRRGLEERVTRRYRVIQNGFDPDDFAGAPPALDRSFTVSYLGNMNDARNPNALWNALSSPALRDIRVRLIGNVDPVVMESARARGLGDRVEILPYVAHADAVRFMRSTSLLLLVINRVRGAEGITTGKLYEYIASGRPILAIGPVTGDAAHILADSSAGRMFDYEDVPGVTAYLEEHLQAFRRDVPLGGADPSTIDRYSRRAQTGELADVLSEIAGRT